MGDLNKLRKRGISMQSRIFKKNPDLAWRVIDKEAVIVPLDEQAEDYEKMDFFNETGTKLWELIDGRNSIKNIIDEICREYEIISEDAKKEVLSFIEKLEKNWQDF